MDFLTESTQLPCQAPESIWSEVGAASLSRVPGSPLQCCRLRAPCTVRLLSLWLTSLPTSTSPALMPTVPVPDPMNVTLSDAPCEWDHVCLSCDGSFPWAYVLQVHPFHCILRIPFFSSSLGVCCNLPPAPYHQCQFLFGHIDRICLWLCYLHGVLERGLELEQWAWDSKGGAGSRRIRCRESQLIIGKETWGGSLSPPHLHPVELLGWQSGGCSAFQTPVWRPAGSCWKINFPIM